MHEQAAGGVRHRHWACNEAWGCLRSARATLQARTRDSTRVGPFFLHGISGLHILSALPDFASALVFFGQVGVGKGQGGWR